MAPGFETVFWPANRTRNEVENAMSKAALLCVALIGMFAGSGAAARAENYPYCLKNDAGAGDCKYTTYEQCLVSLSGRDGYCQRDPYFEVRRR